MKRKKFWIKFGCICAGIVIVVVGMLLLTGLKTVNVEFTQIQAESRLSEDVFDNVKKGADLKYGKSLLFTNVDDYAKKIEKSNCFVKVEKIVRIFPNKINIYISERVPKYRMRETGSDNKWYILDSEFKVLDISTTEQLSSKNYLTKTVEVSYLTTTAYVGDFLSDEKNMQNLTTILSGIYAKTEDYFVVKSIDYDEPTNTFSLVMQNSIQVYEYNGGCILKFTGSNNLKDKVFLAVSAYFGGQDSEGNVPDFNKLVIFISDDSNQCILQNQEE